MAANTSPSGPMHPQHAPGMQPNGHVHPHQKPSQHLLALNEECYVRLGQLFEGSKNYDGAIHCFESALRQNAYSIQALLGIANIFRSKDAYPQAIDYLRAITKFEERNGEVWETLGHCYLMSDNLPEAYAAYQQALYHLQDLKEPKLWYGIGILYDRYGSLDHAEEAFSQVMRMAPSFEKANEIYFRLGIIYKQQGKYAESLDCFRYIVADPPKPLTVEDIWFQIGHVYEQQKDYNAAKESYKHVLEQDPGHAKVLQQLGWLHHQQSQDFASQEQAIDYLERSVKSDPNDAQSWYLLGRCYMALQKYPKAYESYQQAVYRDGRNPTFWCSIGVLYYQIHQYRDALDAYSRAIRLNPNISEVWYDLGTLYESCNNQTADALDAYQRAAELDPSNVHIKARLNILRASQEQGGMPNQAPMPQDVHPQSIQPTNLNGPPPQWNGGSSAQQSQSRGAPPQLDYSSRLAEIQTIPPHGPQAVQPFDHRDGPRSQTLPGPPRPGSPPHDSRGPPRHYGEPPRSGPPPRRLTPSPKSRNAAPQYPSSQPPLHRPMHDQPPPSHQPPTRIANPNYGPQTSLSGPPQPTPPQHSGYGRVSPQHERAPYENRPSSTGAQMPPYRHHPPPSSVPPQPTPPHQGPPHGDREREEARTPIPPPKRNREWEDEPNSATKDEKRLRLEDPRMSGHDRPLSPPRHIEDSRRAEEHRRINDGYHPSEVAHHPPTGVPPPHSGPSPQSSSAQPPPLNQTTPPQQQAPPPTYAPESHRAKEPSPLEPAARKMEVDENYDDDVEEDSSKRGPGAGTTPTKRESPRTERDLAAEAKQEGRD